ncbi:MAG: antibiotic biosynthesis monooxygenase [Acidobacteria bacterium]|nr:antibiotic biosynthesis monooxygenase [Acidobacteriota bacterium]
MSVVVRVEAQAKPDTRDVLIDALRDILPETRAYEGCDFVDVLCDLDNPDTVVLAERWTSREHYQTYINWRAERGDLDKLIALLSGPPSFRFFEKVDA